MKNIVADATRLNTSGVAAGFAIRCTAGVAIALIVAAFAGQPLAGVSAAYGALVVGFASRNGTYRTRAMAMILTGVALAVSAFAGAVTGDSVAANVLVLAVLALAFGLVASVGGAATTAAVNGVVAFVIFANPPYAGQGAAFQASMVLAGALLQTLLLVAAWPLQRARFERAALASAFAGLRDYALGVHANDLGLPDAQPLAALNAALADPQPFASRAELAVYVALADEVQRLRATLAALANDQHLLDEVGLSGPAAGIGALCARAGAILERIGAAIATARPPQIEPAAWSVLDDAVRGLEAASAADAAPVADARALAGQLRAAARIAASVDGAAPNLARVAPVWVDVPAWRDGVATVRANLTWTSMYARHAIRLAVALTIAVALQHVLPLVHGQWIALTVALVLRPNFSSTFSRGIARVAGTVAGAAAMAGIGALHPAGSAYEVLAIVFAGAGFAVFDVSYALFSVAITGYVVSLLAFGGAAEGAAAFDRVLATIVGGALALAAYAAWPAWTHDRIADDLAELIDAQRRFAELVLRAYLDPGACDNAAVRSAQAATWLARSNAEAMLEQMAGEPARPRDLSVRSARSILAATRRFALATLTLYARLSRAGAAPRDALERFVRDLDGALATISAALRDRAQIAPLPPLRGDQIMLKRALDGDPAVQSADLVSETDTMVDSANTMAALLARAR